MEINKDFSAQFKNLGIFILKREEILSALQQRKKLELNVQRLNDEQKKSIVEEMKTFNQNETKLCFEAVYKDGLMPVDGYGVLSDTIYNSKATATSDLKICRISLFKGSHSGDEDMIILCDKIKKDDVEVKFFELKKAEAEEGDEDIVWEKLAKFNPSDVHYQVAIPFKTPKYDGPTETNEIQVFIQLSRKSDGKMGEPVQFVYKRDSCRLSKKRKLSDDDFIDANFNIQDLLNAFDQNGCLASFDDDSDISYQETSNSNSQDGFLLKDAVIVNQCVQSTNEVVGQMSGVLSSLSLEDSNCEEDSKWFSRGVQSLLKNRNILYYVPESIKIQDEEGNSILHMAILENLSLKFIETTIKQIKENIVNHRRDLDKKTPLHLATQLGNEALLDLLLWKSGGDPTIKDIKGNSCLHIASVHNFSKCMESLCSRCLEFPSAIDSENDDGLTPLHLSILNDSRSCFEILINYHADINVQEKKGGKSPLHLAIERKSSFIEILLSHPHIDIHCTNFKGQTALEQACEENEICYDDLPNEVKENKEKMLMYLKQIFEMQSAELDPSLKIDLENKENELQQKIEKVMNKTSAWMKLGPLAGVPHLHLLPDIEENPAGSLIEMIKEGKGLTLKEIIDMAGLAEMLSEEISEVL